MKTSVLFVSLLLAVSATAAPQNRNGGFRGGRQRQGGGRQQNGQQQAGQQQAGQAGQGAGQNGQQAGNQQQGGQQGNNNAGNGGAAGGDPQTSLTLDPKVIADGFKNNGQSTPEPGQVASLTSSNNFINFCLTSPNSPITNGKQITTGSCNPAPIGLIPSIDNMPSSKIVNPPNNGNVPANQKFTLVMAIRGMQTGAFVNAQENYFAAPQQLNGQGQIIGHSHVVVEQLDSLTQTTPTDPKKFAFFKGLNAAAQNGQLTADVDNGLPAGAYRVCSINAAANHQPVIVPVAQHGALDDCSYFTVGNAGNAGQNNGQNNGQNGAAGGANNGANGGAAGQQGQQGQGQGQQGGAQGQQGGAQGQQGQGQGQQGQQQGQNRGGRGGRGGRNRQQRSLLSRVSL